MRLRTAKKQVGDDPGLAGIDGFGWESKSSRTVRREWRVGVNHFDNLKPLARRKQKKKRQTGQAESPRDRLKIETWNFERWFRTSKSKWEQKE